MRSVLFAMVCALAALGAPAQAQKPDAPPIEAGVEATGAVRFVFGLDAPLEIDQMGRLTEVLVRRANAAGVLSATASATAPDRVELLAPYPIAGEDIASLRARLMRSGALGFHAVLDDDPASVARAEAAGLAEDRIAVAAPDERLIVERAPRLGPGMLAGAEAVLDEWSGAPALNIRFSAQGAELLCALTGSLEGRRMAIVLDGAALSAPLIHTPICAGQAQITGQFAIEEARALAELINIGALPAELHLLEESIIGPR